MERVISGIAASSGIGIGPAFSLADLTGSARTAGDADSEAKALSSAVKKAALEIAELAAAQEGEAAEILGFQVAMLEDDALAEEAFALIETGAAADQAWRTAMAVEIDGYQSSDDDYFRARAADLSDIRDRVLAALFGVESDRPLPQGSIIVADDLKPSQFLSADWTGGGAIVLGQGSPSSHVAMLARARSVPMVVGIGEAWHSLSGPLVVDGSTGLVTVKPSEATILEAKAKSGDKARQRQEAEQHILEPAVTKDGTLIKVMVNVAALSDLEGLPVDAVDGVGLTRTEFLVEQALHDEDAQAADYTALLQWAGQKPVTIRTFDAGGDKPVKGYTVDGESNPFLGLRGIRLSLMHKDVFKIQLRAILRASMQGNAKIMLPMVTSPADLENARELLHACRDELISEGVLHALPQFGIMVEVPAVALSPNMFDAAFYSIGSNDLTQYATAAGRDNAASAKWADVAHPGVLAMIAHVARHGVATGKEVSLCGDAGGDPAVIGKLLHAGIRAVSVAPGLVAMAKAAIRAVDLSVREEAA